MSQKITYCLWSDMKAEEILDFYASVFPDLKKTEIVYNPVDTPSGNEDTVLNVNFNLGDQSFMILNGGPEFKLNPAISFMVNCQSEKEVEELWNKLKKGGNVKMPLDKYPFSDKYGWIEDRYGVSWQLILPKGKASQRIVPSLMFVKEVCGKAEEAITYYTSIFKNSKLEMAARYPKDMDPEKEGTIMFADFTLEKQYFAAMDSAQDHQFEFNESISFVVHCDTQEEIDYYWDKLLAGGKEMQCGWLRDKYGVAWQVVPDQLLKLIQGKDKSRAKRVMNAMMKMVKLDLETIEKA